MLRPGGRLVLSWGDGGSPSRITRALALPADQLDQIRTALADRLDDVEPITAEHCVVFLARRAA